MGMEKDRNRPKTKAMDEPRKSEQRGTFRPPTAVEKDGISGGFGPGPCLPRRVGFGGRFGVKLNGF